jgi:hypothetical protein
MLDQFPWLYGRPGELGSCEATEQGRRIYPSGVCHIRYVDPHSSFGLWPRYQAKRIDSATQAGSVITLDPFLPCWFGRLRWSRSAARAQHHGLVEVTVTVR